MQHNLVVQGESQRRQVDPGSEPHPIGREEIIEVNEGHVLAASVHGIETDRVDCSDVDDVIIDLTRLTIAT